MHLTSIVKSVVLIVAFATQYVYAKSQNGYGYFDEKFCVFEWIIYLKRLSLIALILCGVVLYYVPKSRSYARRACCILIDTVADGLKYALDTNETEQEKIKAADKNNQNKELRIQELYRKVYEEDTRDHEQKYINKTNFNNSNHKSIRKCKSKKFGTKHTVERKHERHRHNRHHLNVTNDVLSEPNAAMMNNPQQTTIIGEKCENDNVIILQDTPPKIRIATYSMLENKLKNNIDSRQENSLNKKTDFNTDPEIIDKSDTRTFKTPSQKDVRDIDTELDIDIKKLQNKQNFDCMHEEVAVAFQNQSSKDCAIRIMNKQTDPYTKLFTKQNTKNKLPDGLQKRNCRFHHDINSFTQDCSKNSKERVKPVLLRVVNWIFGGCPEASRRHQEQIDKVGKEEIFESTNTWLL